MLIILGIFSYILVSLLFIILLCFIEKYVFVGKLFGSEAAGLIGLFSIIWPATLVFVCVVVIPAFLLGKLVEKVGFLAKTIYQKI